MARKPKRVILIGLDGAIPEFVRKFEDKLPNVKALIRRGVFTSALSSPPVDTPTNWTTIATGSWTGTHGINGFTIRIPSQSPDRILQSFNSRLCQAEYLWNALERGGKKCILVNYPTAWPHTLSKSIVVGGDGIFSQQWCVGFAGFYTTREKVSTDIRPLVGIGNVGEILRWKPVGNWRNKPASILAPLEAMIRIDSGISTRWSDHGFTGEERKVGEGDGIFYYLLLYAASATGYDTLLIAKDRDAEQPLAILKEGQWSDWIYEDFPTLCRGSFKFKLLKLSSDAEDVKLYRTDAYALQGWSYPENIARELLDNVGPYHEGWEHPIGIRFDWFGVETWFEHIHMQIEWLTTSCEYLTTHYDWDFLATQIHLQDVFNHAFLSFIERGFPGYSAEKSEWAWRIFEKVYQAADVLINEIVKRCSDEETVVIVLSDHGGLPVKKAVQPVAAVVRAGLVTYERHNDVFLLNRERSKVLDHAGGFWINLQGREKDGIVAPGAEYEKVRDRLISALYSIRDPESGLCPYALIVRKEDARTIGLWGERVADVVTFLQPTYMWGGLPQILSVEAFERIDSATTNFSSPTTQGGHGEYLPHASFGDASNSALLIMAGPGVQQGYENLQPSMNLVDVAPTIAYLLDAPQPANAEGRILFQFLE